VIGNSHARFLGEGREATPEPYPITRRWFTGRSMTKALLAAALSRELPRWYQVDRQLSNIGRRDQLGSPQGSIGFGSLPVAIQQCRDDGSN